MSPSPNYRPPVAFQTRPAPIVRKPAIPFLGVRVDRKTIESQRYLRDHGMPHTARVAAIPLPSDGRVPYRTVL